MRELLQDSIVTGIFNIDKLANAVVQRATEIKALYPDIRLAFVSTPLPTTKSLSTIDKELSIATQIARSRHQPGRVATYTHGFVLTDLSLLGIHEERVMDLSGRLLRARIGNKLLFDQLVLTGDWTQSGVSQQEKDLALRLGLQVSQPNHIHIKG